MINRRSEYYRNLQNGISGVGAGDHRMDHEDRCAEDLEVWKEYRGGSYHKF